MAVAGTVAPIFKDEYNSTVIYNFYNVVNHNNKMWICKVDGTTGIEPNENNSDYWYLAIDGADAASLGGETASAWQNKLDSIQTTSSGTLSEVGWYRVAEYVTSALSHAYGAIGNSCDLRIKKPFHDSFTETFLIKLKSVFQYQEFKVLESNNNNNFTKVRYTVDETKNTAYIEVYYAQNVGNDCFFEISHGKDSEYTWQAITPVLTSETVDGVTITCTYDIPSDASPVTDLDLATLKGIEILNTSILAKAIELSSKSSGTWKYNLGGGAYTGNDLPSGYIFAYGIATIEIRNPNSIVVSIKDENGNSAVNGYNGITWIGWKVDATTSDLANYLPLSGGEMSGLLNLALTRINKSGDEAKELQFFQDGAFKIAIGTNAEAFNIYSTTLGHVLKIPHDGSTPTFNGVASGNAVISVTSSAPSNTSALWYDTVNKVLKRYVDGAWQQ